MFLDLHCHSSLSDDARATVEGYVQWAGVLRQRGYQVDGFVLTEHRRFDPHVDYTPLARRHGLLILKGAEVETRAGHFLVYGVRPELLRRVDFSDTALDPESLLREAERAGAIAIPAHPGRRGIGLAEFLGRGATLDGLRALEVLNGGSQREENQRAQDLARALGLPGTGGSDAHFTSTLARYLTAFPDPIRSEEDLVEALYSGRFRAVPLEETRETGTSQSSVGPLS